MTSISLIGLGKLGAPMAACLASKGFTTVGVDLNESVVEAINEGRPPVYEPALADKFVGMYVNHYTVDCGQDVPKAAQLLLDLGHEAGIIPHKIKVEFVR